MSEGYQPEPYNPEVPSLIRGPPNNNAGYWPSQHERPGGRGRGGPGHQHQQNPPPFPGQQQQGGPPPTMHGRGALVSVPTVEDEMQCKGDVRMCKICE